MFQAETSILVINLVQCFQQKKFKQGGETPPKSRPPTTMYSATAEEVRQGQKVMN